MITSQPTSKNKKKISSEDLPLIPDKRYFTIGEVGDLCDLKPYVLRYWEQEFPQLKPNKRRGNRRYYQHKDILVIRQIRKLLYNEGFTIEGARAKLADSSNNVVKSVESNAALTRAIADLENILEKLSKDSN